MRLPQKMEVRLSGRVRVRPGLFGRIVPQVELRTFEYSACPPFPGRDRNEWDQRMRADGVTSYSWRDATWGDMTLIGLMVSEHQARDGGGVPEGGKAAAQPEAFGIEYMGALADVYVLREDAERELARRNEQYGNGNSARQLVPMARIAGPANAGVLASPGETYSGKAPT